MFCAFFRAGIPKSISRAGYLIVWWTEHVCYVPDLSPKLFSSCSVSLLCAVWQSQNTAMFCYDLLDSLNSNNNKCRSLLHSINCLHLLVGSRNIVVFKKFSSNSELAWHMKTPPGVRMIRLEHVGNKIAAQASLGNITKGLNNKLKNYTNCFWKYLASIGALPVWQQR